MPTTLFQSLSTQFTYAKESTYGTWLAATDSLPVKTLKLENVYKTIVDENWRGIAAKDFQYRQGVVFGQADLETQFYPDQTAAVLMWIMGSDTISGGSATKTGTIGSIAAGVTTATYTVSTGAAQVAGDVFTLDASGANTNVAEEVILSSVSGGGPYTINFTTTPTRFAHANAAPASNLVAHALQLASVPSSYSANDNTTYANRQLPGIFWEEVTLKWATDAEFMVTAKGRGTKVTNTGSQQTFTASSDNLFVGWAGAMNLNSVADTQMIDFELNLKRPLELVWGAGSQVPTAAIPGALEVSGKCTFAVAGNTENALYEAGNAVPMSVLFQSQTQAKGLLIRMTTAAFETPTSIERSKIYHTLAASFRGIYNTTDAGPVYFQANNTRASAFI
jgi:hypothetical protein